MLKNPMARTEARLVTNSHRSRFHRGHRSQLSKQDNEPVLLFHFHIRPVGNVPPNMDIDYWGFLLDH